MNENLELRKVKALEKIADRLEKLNEGKDDGTRSRRFIENVADEIEPFEPTLARLLRHYAE